MQFVYTNYVYINTRDIKGKLMFAFGPYIPTHRHCINPYGATIANPRIGFGLAIAAATAMPMYRPCMPVFGFGYAYNPTPAFGALTTRNYLNAPVHNYAQYFNRVPNIQISTPSFNTYSNTNNNTNPFGYFNNYNNIRIIPMATGSSTISSDESSSTNTTTSSDKTQSSTTATNNTKVATDGQKLNRSGSDYGPEFLAKVKEIANRLDCDYRDLLGLMNSESGIRADIKNPNGSASGLIQFIESTANSLGTTTAELRAMNPIDQLDYVEKYLVQIKAQAGLSGRLSAGDLYSLVFLPGRAHRDVLTSSGEKYYAHNRGLDLNKDGQITKAELGQRVHNKYVSDNSFLA